jgi:hypothetical protein
MANDVLNKVAALEQRRRGPRCLVRSLGFGPWDGGMVDDGLKERFASLGVPLIPLDGGAAAFKHELTAQSGESEVLLTGTSKSGHLFGPPPSARGLTAEVHVSRRTHPFLEGHRVKGAVVVPVALCLEWFARAAQAFRPHLAFVGCRDVQVLRGIRLSAFEGAGDTLTINVRPLTEQDEVTVELLSADGTRHYTATCALTATPPSPERRAPELPELSPWTQGLYDGTVLFHGAPFQVIESVDGVSENAMSARMAGLEERAWAGAWALDPALLDGGLQLALLWTSHRLGGAGLPTAIASVAIHATGPVKGRVRCVLQGREVTRDRTVCDVAFIDSDKTVLAELRGVEVHLLPRASGRATAEEAAMPRAS